MKTKTKINQRKAELIILTALMLGIAIIGIAGNIEAYEGEKRQDSLYIVKNTISRQQDKNVSREVDEIFEREASPLCDLEAVVCPDEKQGTIESLIAHYSDIYNFNKETALRIADCESKTGKYKHNWEGSSAKGVYMFMPKTFNAYCDGNIDIEEDQIICFMKLYPKYPEWWECK